MFGPGILARSIAAQRIVDAYGNEWQYNSQSDSHSKAACWGVAFDLLRQSAVLRSHIEEGKIVMGVNHPMVDFRTGKEKKLDLVFARPATPGAGGGASFKAEGQRYGLSLTQEEQDALDQLPDVPIAKVGAILVALEAKAVMTKHVSSLPRLHDELAASEQAVHGASASALAIAYVQINASPEFAPSPSNRFAIDAQRPMIIRRNAQPSGVEKTLNMLRQQRRRSSVHESGFDGIGVTVVDFENRGGPVHILADAPAPQPGESYHYDTMVVRMAHEFDARFTNI